MKIIVRIRRILILACSALILAGSVNGMFPYEVKCKDLPLTANELNAKSIALKFAYARQLQKRGNLPQRIGFSVVSVRTHRETGITHTKFQVKYMGVPIFGKQVIIAVDKNDKVLYADRVRAISEADLGISTTPAISTTDAIEIVKKALVQSTSFVGEKVELYILDASLIDKSLSEIGIHLVWKVDIVADEPPGEWVYFVNVHSGDVVFHYNNFKGAKYRRIYDAEFHPYWEIASLPGTLLLEEGGSSSDPDAMAAYDNVGLTYDYYWNTHGRDSYGDAGDILVASVHVDWNWNNAAWSPYLQQMLYGDGDGVIFSPLSHSLDVCAHELTHAVIENEADLIYAGQSGALNESYADFFACMVDRADWLIGEDVYTPGTPGDALRSVADPPSCGDPDHLDDYVGEVHIDAGIPNKAAYNIATSLDRGIAERIYYYTLCNKLTPSSQFMDACIQTMVACSELYPGRFDTLNAIQNGFAEVGIGRDTLAQMLDRDGNPKSTSGTLQENETWYGNYTLSHNIDLNGYTLELELGTNLTLNGYSISGGSFINFLPIVVKNSNADTTGWYSSIYYAVNHSTNGDTIWVSSDTYDEYHNIDIPLGITLTIASSSTINLHGHSLKSTGGTIVVGDSVTWVDPAQLSQPAAPAGTIYGNPPGSGTGYVQMSWSANPEPYVTGYKVLCWNGGAYQQVADVGTTISWSSQGAGVWPTSSEILNGGYTLHSDGSGGELWDDPHWVYTNEPTVYYDDATNYWFRVQAYSTFAPASDYSYAWMPTLPNTRFSTAQNTSFEEVSGSDIVDWYPYGDGSFSSSTVHIEGTKSAHFVRTVANTGYYSGFYQRYIEVEPNTTYYLGVWVKTANMTSGYVMPTFGVWENGHIVSIGHITQDTDWTYLHGSWTAGPNEDRIQIQLPCATAFVGEAWFDGLYFGTEPPPNHAPVLSSIGNKSVNENQNLSFTISATDPDGDALSYSASNLPSGASFNSTTRTFSWTPSYSQSGTYSNVHFEVSDGHGGTDYENITITVNDVDIEPPNTTITSPSNGSFDYDGNRTFYYTGSDNVTPTSNLKYSCRLGGGSWSSDTLSTSKNHSGLCGGSHTFEVKAKDEAGNVDPSPASVTICVVITPTGLSASAGNHYVDLSWNASCGTTGYDISYWRYNPYNHWVIDVGNVTSKRISGLTNGVKYYFRVRARTECGTGAWSGYVTATPYGGCW